MNTDHRPLTPNYKHTLGAVIVKGLDLATAKGMRDTLANKHSDNTYVVKNGVHGTHVIVRMPKQKH